MMANSIYRGVIVAAFFFLSACSDVLDGPTEDDLGKQLAFELPTGVRVESVDIIVAENIGSEVEPRYRHRAKATLQLAEDRVEVVEQLDDKYILKTVAEEGMEFDVTLISTSVLINDKWKVSFDKVEGRQVTGAPLGQFVEGTYAYENSEEANEIIAAYEARLKAEKEAAEAEARHRQEVAQARAEKEAAEKAARIKAFREYLAGTWLSKSPVFRNNAPYLTRNNESAGLEISFPEGDQATGKARVTLFVNEDLTDDVSVDVNFTVADSGEYATVFLRTRTSHRRLNWTFSENWTINADGVFQTSNNRDRWYAQMEKDGPALAAKREEEARLERRIAAIEGLIKKHRAFIGKNRLREVGLNSNTFGPVFIDSTALKEGTVWGDQYYAPDSSLVSTAIHAGVLAQGESGVVKLTRRNLDQRTNFQGTVKNGIQTEQFRGRDVYEIELIEKLNVD